MKHTIRNILFGALLAIGLGVPYLQAADVAISALPAGSALAGTEAIPAVQAAATVKTTPAAIKTYVETGGTVVASDPVLDLSQTWNNAAVTFTGVKLNVTDTASAAASKLFDVQNGGTTIFNVKKDSVEVSQTTYPGYGQIDATNRIDFNVASSRIFTIRSVTGVTGAMMSSDSVLGFTGGDSTQNPDTNLYRDAAATLAQRNTTTAQTFRVYSTTDAGLTNYERLAINAGAAGDWLQIAAETAGTGADNIGIALTPAGTGAISAHVPDSGTAGGNARGANAVDWQTTRSAAAQVASGSRSIALGGNNTASDAGSIAIGYLNSSSAWDSIAIGRNNTSGGSYASAAIGNSNTATGNSSAAIGLSNTASAAAAVALGNENTASGPHSWVPGGNRATTRALTGAYAYSSGRRSALGDAQVIGQPVRQTTVDTAPVVPVSMATDGTPAATTVMVVPASSTMMCTGTVTAQSGSGADNAGYELKAAVQRDGANNTTLVGAAYQNFVVEDTAAMDATIIANDTLDSVEIQVSGKENTTVYWAGELKCVQVL